MNTIAVVQDQCCNTVTLKLLIMSTNMERKLVKIFKAMPYIITITVRRVQNVGLIVPVVVKHSVTSTVFIARCYAERGYEIVCRLSVRLSVRDV